ncbi:MAG: hypothetical protein ABSB67_15085, partial [Bryobacteraceae bacterium]
MTDRAVIEFGDQHGGLENAIIEQMARGDVAAHRRNKQQQGQRHSFATIRQHANGPVLKAQAAMPLSVLVVTDFGERVGQSLMCLRVCRVGLEGSFIAFSRGFELARFEEDITQVDEAHGIGGMPGDRLRICGSRGGPIAGGMQERAQVVQSEAMRGFARQQLEISVASFPSAAHFREQTGEVEAKIHIIRTGRHASLEIQQCRFLRPLPPIRLRLRRAALSGTGFHRASKLHGFFEEGVDLPSGGSMIYDGHANG